MSDLTARRAEFRRLHESGCFVIPNPWDAGSAKYLESLGFKALATTSAGFAFTQALADHPADLRREGVLANAAEIVTATSLPVNCDYQSGYGNTPEEVAESVRLCVATGVAGLSIEDSTGDKDMPLFVLEAAVERMKAARAAIDSTGQDVLLCGRAECFLVGHPDPLRESLTRLRAYADAGADVLFAPGLRSLADAQETVRAVSPKPVNVLIGWKSDFGVAELANAGVRRISVGSALSRAGWAGFIQAAKKLSEGSFDGFAWATPFAELNGLFGRDQ